MTKLFTPVRALACLLLLPFLFASCQSKQAASDTEKTDSTSITLSTSGVVDNTRDPIPTIKLSSLTVTSGVFKAHRNENFVFQHFLSDTDVTLHGWALKRINGGPGQYNPNPDVTLTPFQQTTLTVGPNSYIGNQVLTKGNEKDMVDEIGNKNMNLYFVPTQDTPGGRIYYKIYIFTPGQLPFDNMKPHFTSYSTNPSPPHQGFD